MDDRMLGTASTHMIGNVVRIHLVGHMQEVIEGELVDTTKTALILTSGDKESPTVTVVPKRQMLYVTTTERIGQHEGQ